MLKISTQCECLNLRYLKHEMESEYPELFKGIGCMDGEISIKLKEGAIPHVEPIRQGTPCHARTA